MRTSPLDSRPRRHAVTAAVTGVLSLVGAALPVTGPALAAPMTFVVTSLGDAGPGTLRNAVVSANANAGADTIVFAAGLTGTIPITSGPLDIQDDVTIDGPGSAALTLDGADGNRIVFSFTPGTDLELTGMTLTRGASGSLGGAIVFVDGHDLVLDDVVITDSAADEGGAIAVVGATGEVLLTSVEMTGNTATGGNGGALMADGVAGRLRLEDSDVSGNRTLVGDGGGVYSVDSHQFDLVESTIADNESVGRSGGIEATSEFVQAVGAVIERNQSATSQGGGRFESTASNLIVEKVVVEGNTAATGVGGLELVHPTGDIAVTSSTIAGNTAAYAAGVSATAPAGVVRLTGTVVEGNTTTVEGGNLFIGNSVGAVLDGSVVRGNTAAVGAGVVLENVVTATVTGSTIVGNHAIAGAGGGVYAFSGGMRVIDSTVSGNTAGTDGAGIFLHSAALTAQFSTITENSATTSGGGIAMTGAGPSATLSHTALAANTAPVGPDAAGAIDADWSLISDAAGLTTTGADNLVGVDAELLPLADNGGPTPTHRPGPTSPLVDAGSPVLAAVPSVDQRGADRIVGVIDIGAVEIQTSERPVWIPVEPARILDTRPGQATIDGLDAGGGRRPGDSTVEVDVAGRAGIPDDAVGVIVNLTAVAPSDIGFATAHACLPQLPTAASLNYTGGVNLGNEVIAGLDGDGHLCVFTKTETHLTLDVVGYVPASSPYTPVAPARLLETRAGFGTVDGAFAGGPKPGADHEVELDVAGRGGVPDDAASVVVYVTAVRVPEVGFVTVYDCNQPMPTASSLNYVAGVNRGNEIVATLSSSGTICLFTKQGVDLTVDVVGYLPAGTEFEGLAKPARLLETRAGQTTIDGQFQAQGARPAGSTLELQLAGRAGIPDDASSVVLNLTAIRIGRNGFVTVSPCGPRPLASSLNYTVGVNGGNDIVVGLSDAGSVCIYTLESVDLTVDVSGYTRPHADIPEPTAH